MDPISIIASVIAIAQAGDRLAQLIPEIREYFTAFEQIDALAGEVYDLKHVLDAVHAYASNLPDSCVTGLENSLASCSLIVLELERILTYFLNRPPRVRANILVQMQMHRIRWVKKKALVERLRQRLRDAKATLMLQLLTLNPVILCQGIMTREASSNNLSVSSNPNYGTRRDSLELYHKKSILGIPAFRQPGNPENALNQMERDVLEDDIKDFLVSPPEHHMMPETRKAEDDDRDSEALSIRIQTSNFPGSSYDGCAVTIPSGRSQKLQMTGLITDAAANFECMFCMRACKCSCHCRLSKRLHLINGHFGSILISRTGQPFKPEKCSQGSCIKRCMPSLLIVFYIRIWFTLAVISFAFSNAGRIRVTLSFPIVVIPGSDFFSCIRAGHCERIRLLLATGAASVASIVAPYGLTPLALAICYQQEEVCRLLIQAGAQLIAPNCTWAKSDISKFYAGFSLLNSSIAAGSVLQVYMRLCSPEAERKAMQSCVVEDCFQPQSYTRLHKCVLGLTLESVDTVARQSRLSINETDSIGRTTLHWAAYIGNASTIDTLLRCGANPNVFDLSTTTPLHAAAGLGSISCVTALINGGADLESRDRFGATPLHYAFQQGHMEVIEGLIQEGASYEAENYFGETPFSYAFHGEKLDVIKAFLNRSSVLNHIDEWGYTPVLDAILLDCHKVLELLLQVENANTRAKLVDDKTLLHVAALNADLQTIEILQRARLTGLDTTAVDRAGYTAMDYVRQRRDAADLIEPFGALLLSIHG